MDAKNAINKINKIGMLCTFLHIWSSRAHSFYCYCNWSLLVLQNANGTASFLHSRVGATLGDPLAMVAYSIGIIPLIKNMKAEFLDVTQPWYGDYAGALGTFANAELYYNSLNGLDRDMGITPMLLKSF